MWVKDMWFRNKYEKNLETQQQNLWCLANACRLKVEQISFRGLEGLIYLSPVNYLCSADWRDESDLQRNRHADVRAYDSLPTNSQETTKPTHEHVSSACSLTLEPSLPLGVRFQQSPVPPKQHHCQLGWLWPKVLERLQLLDSNQA